MRPCHPCPKTALCLTSTAAAFHISNCWHASALLFAHYPPSVARPHHAPLASPSRLPTVAYFSAHAILMPIASARTHRVDPTLPLPLALPLPLSLPEALPCPYTAPLSPTTTAAAANFMSSKNINQQSFFRARIPRSTRSHRHSTPSTHGFRTVRLQQDVAEQKGGRKVGMGDRVNLLRCSCRNCCFSCCIKHDTWPYFSSMPPHATQHPTLPPHPFMHCHPLWYHKV